MKHSGFTHSIYLYAFLIAIALVVPSCEKIPGKVITGSTTISTGSTGSTSSGSTATLPNASSVAIGAKNTFIYKIDGKTTTLTLATGLNTFAGDPTSGQTYIAVSSGSTGVNLNFAGASTGKFSTSKIIINEGFTNIYNMGGSGHAVITVYNAVSIFGSIQGTFYCLADKNGDKNYRVLDGSFNLSSL